MKDSTKNIIANIIGLIILGINVYMYFWQDEGLTSFLTILGVSLALFMFKGTQTKAWLEKALGKFLSK
jgi:type III secretory pathway component EscS